MPHGDLKALTGADLMQPRHVVFRTDGEGFRNDHEYAPGQYVLVGDSYVVGIVDTQDDMLSVQLARDYRLPTYNLAHPGDISDYLVTWRAFRLRHLGPVKGLLFLFEGNDFEPDYKLAANGQPGMLSRWASKYYGLFTATDLNRVTRSLYTRAVKYRSIAHSDSVMVKRINGQDMGFYMPYVNASRRPSVTLPSTMVRDLEELGGEMERIYFIPTKYRVYAHHLGVAALPDAQWQALSRLCEKNAWRCGDLTADLVNASDELLKTGEFTWWRDDTHWNRQGMAVAARAVARDLASSQAVAAR